MALVKNTRKRKQNNKNNNVRIWIEKFKLICEKNWMIFKSRKISAILEPLWPTLFFIAVIIFCDFFFNGKIIESKLSTEFNINPPLCQYQHQEITKLAYSPEVEFPSKLMQDVSKNFNVDLKPFKDETGLHSWIRNQTEPVAAVLFEGNIVNPPKHLRYTIRMSDDTKVSTKWNTDKLYDLKISKEPRSNSLSHHEFLYYSTCFLKLQNEIDQAFILSLYGFDASFPKLKMLKPFPIPEAKTAFLQENGAYAIPIMVVVSVVLSVIMLVKNITIERESRLTESMKIMGLSSALYWSSWFMRSFIILLISFTINLILTVTSIISEVPMFANSNPFIIWIFFMSYITSMITFCFLVSVVFKKTSRALFFGLIIFAMAFTPYLAAHNYFFKFNYGLKVLFSMLTNTNMGQGIKMILMAEVNDGGVGFGNLFKRSVDMKFSFGELLFWMNIGSVLQVLLTILIEKVFSDESDIIVQKYIKNFGNNFIKNVNESSQNNPPDVEMAPLCSDSIEIRELTKKFGNKYAVKKVSLTLIKNQITVLCGPNGAGKTTVVSILTGLNQPSLGTVTINGFDICTQTGEARSSMGVCLQENVFFVELTVQENLEFFCRLKGMTDIESIQNDIQKYTKSLGIYDQLSSKSKELTDEQKRKLSIAIALCGDPKFVVLDEPMDSLDKISRQQLSDLLNAEKKHRTILVTTVISDEAELFGDQIAIMSNGRLYIVESSLNLQQKLRFGHRLTCIKDHGFEAQAVINKIKNIIEDLKKKPEASKCENKGNIPDTINESQTRNKELDLITIAGKKAHSNEVVKQKSDSIQSLVKTIDLEHLFLLESESNEKAVFVISKDLVPIFDTIFKTIHNSSEQMKISSLKYDYTSFGDAVLQLSNTDFKDDNKDAGGIETTTNIQNLETIEIRKIQLSDKNVKILSQFHAMFLKKFYMLRESWTTFVIFGSISVIATFLIPSLFHIGTNMSTKLRISLDSYAESEVLIETYTMSNISDKFIDLFAVKDKVLEISDMETEVLEKFNNSQIRNQKNLLAVKFKNNLVTVWYNSQPYHTMPLAVNTVNRAILKSVVGSDYDITVTNHPFTENDDFIDNSVIKFLIISLLLLVWPQIYIGNYIKEREIRFKFLQFMCGTNQFVYWFANLIFDYILFIVICFVLFGCFVIANSDQKLYLFEILMAVESSYGFSMICFIYAISYLFKKSSTGSFWLLTLSITLSILAFINFSILLNSIQHWFGLCFAAFAPFALIKMNLEFFFGTRPLIYSAFNECILMNFLSGIIFLMITVFRDFNPLAYIQDESKESAKSSSPTIQETNNEILQSSSGIPDNDSIKVFKSLLKNNEDIIAIYQTSLNGNGSDSKKTTVFKIISEDDLTTFDDIWVKKKRQNNQFINFFSKLTGLEILKVFTLICGFKEDKIIEIVNCTARNLNFKDQLNKKVETYSGEDRKKLTAVLAELGNPDLIFLDECKTAADRKVLLELQQMDENEALRKRIDIMLAGQFRCLGPIQDLTNKFSEGFVLTIKTGFTDEHKVKQLRELVVRKFLDVELRWKNLDVFVFRLITRYTELQYSEIFKILSEIKNEAQIKEYSLTQMSLQQLFLNISKYETPFTQKETIEIAEEEGKWRYQEMLERKAKLKEHQKRIKKMNERAKKIGNQIARRLQMENKKPAKLNKKEMEEIKIMEKEKQVLETSVKEEGDKIKQFKLNLKKWSNKISFSKKSNAKTNDKKESDDEQEIAVKPSVSKYKNELKDKRESNFFKTRPINLAEKSDEDSENSDNSIDYESSDEVKH